MANSDNVDDFFERCGIRGILWEDRKWDINCFLARQFPFTIFEPVKSPGYCSFTLLGGNSVVQFRPPKYDLDMDTVKAAKEIYGNLAPSTQFVHALYYSGLLVYSMELLQGVSLKEYRLSPSRRDGNLEFSARKGLCEDFARFLSRAWIGSTLTELPLGMIGLSIKPRLEKLSRELPTRFRHAAYRVLARYSEIESLPWVLAHGDIVPGNIMVNTASGRLTGFVDWAEAEILPFGICLYGLEEILGHMTDQGFQYFEGAEACRIAFWNALIADIPDLEDTAILDAVCLSRELGILLWHGFAFDDGAIDRVVDEAADVTEIQYLEALLAPPIFSTKL